MNALFHVTTASGQFWYDLFYFLGICLAGVVFMLDGNRRNYPLAGLSVVFISGMTFFIIGTKLVTYDADAWRVVLTEFRFPYTERKSVLGGLIGGMAGIWLARRLTRFSYPVLDTLAFTFPLALGLQRIGCFLAGCCYGAPTGVPWAARYVAPSHAYADHLRHGWVESGSAMSLPVHPSQLYEAILCFLVAMAAWKLRNALKRPGNLFFASLGLYLVARTVTENWRHAGPSLYDEAMIPGITWLQGLMIAGALFIAAILYHREKRYRHEPTAHASAGMLPFVAYVLLCLFVLWLGNWFTRTELFVLEALLLSGSFLQCPPWMGAARTRFDYRVTAVYAMLFILVFDVALTAQKTYRELTASPSDRNVINELSLNYGNTALSHYHAAPELSPVYGSGGCGGPVDSSMVSYVLGPSGPLYTENLTSLGAGFRQIRTNGEYNKWEWVAEASGAWTSGSGDPAAATAHLVDLSMAWRYDTRYFGIGLGVHGGTVMDEDEEAGYLYTPDHSAKPNLNVSGSFRFLPYDIFYVDIRINELRPYAQERLRTNQVVFGTGFGLKNGTCLEVGGDGADGIFLAGRAVFNNSIGIRLVLMSGRNAKSSWHIPELSLSYRFPVKTGLK